MAEEGEFAVVSPGVPTEAPLVQFYLNSGLQVFSEIEAASWFTDEDIIAITGSNGKTTVTTWLAHIWETAEKRIQHGWKYWICLLRQGWLCKRGTIFWK